MKYLPTFFSGKIYRLFIVFLFLLFAGNSYSQTWNPLGTGTSGNVNAVIVYNGTLVAAGNFTTAGGNTVNNIAAWNGTSWSPLGTGTNGVVYALAIFGNQLTVAGGFTTAGGNPSNRIARWNGTNWTPLGLGTNDTIYSLAVYSNSLRAAGKFTTAGGVTCTRIARWDGTNWFAMGTGLNNNGYAMVVSGANLVIGGSFTTAGGNTANRITSYNGATYSQFGNGVDNGQVLALALSGTTVFVGGTFTTIGGVTVNNIARWSGTNWNTVGTGITGTVKSFYVNGTSVVVGGSFTNAGGTAVDNIALWGGSSYTTVGTTGLTGGTPSVNGMTLWSNVFIAGGSFTTATDVSVAANNVAGFGSVPVAPLLVSPADGATNQSVTPVLDWTDVGGATTYGVQVSGTPNFTTTLVNASNLATSTYTVPGGILANNVTYFWRATAANGLGTSPFSLVRFFTTGLVGIINNQQIPLSFKLYQNYPNPFNPATTIKFDLPANNNSGAKLNFTIYDIEGKTVASLLNQDYAAGQWEIFFNASDYPSGVYFYKLTAGNYTAVNKMMLIK